VTGRVDIVGLGPGSEGLITPDAMNVIAQATDVIGYIPYVERVAKRTDLTLHPSDNRVEIERASHALKLATEGARVAVVSSGDPGVFAMAAAVFEALEAWDGVKVEIEVHPGVTAMLAAAARLGAPLGHDFCAINLSDNLKPFSLIEKRVRLAVEGDMAMAFYNPRSKSRPQGFQRILSTLQEICEPDRLISFASAVSTPDERIRTVSLKDATPEMADMKTVVIVGSSLTRRVGDHVYTPRSVS